MGTVVVVAVTPVLGHPANLGQAGEFVAVQRCTSSVNASRID
jgi:hypothetical protein